MIHRPRNSLIPLLLALVALALATAGAASAASAKAKPKVPCWRVLINDWYDGRIDGTYPIHCYRDALKNLPADVETYSSARDDIRQALQERITQGSTGKKRNGGTSTSSSASGPTGGGSGPTGGGSGPTGGGSGPTGGTGPASGTNGSNGPIGSAISAGKPSSATSVPVPLIVLGAVALLLMAAGAAGFVARRMRTRKLQLASLPQPSGKPPRGGS